MDESKVDKRIITYILAFSIPVIIGSIVFLLKGVAPFGDQSILCMDLWGQYLPMYVQHTDIGSFSEMAYSWNGGLGYNNLAQSGYYCNSLFLLLLRLFPKEILVNALDWLCLIKTGLASIACLAFLEYKEKKTSALFLSGAIAYSLCSYMLAFMSQPMWTDALIYLPLVILGVERLIQEKKSIFYIFWLALTIYSSFYIGFEVCIFVALYFLADRICEFVTLVRMNKEEEDKKTAVKEFVGSLMRFAGASILAGAVCAWVLLPTVKGIGNTIASEGTAIHGLKFYDNFLTYIQLMVPGQKLKLEYDGANISSGLLCLMFLPVYFFNKKVAVKERVVNGCFLAFLFVSLNCNVLNYIWHGFHFPNQLPGRWTFLFSFFVVYLGCMAVSRMEGLTVIRSSLGLVISVAMFVIACIWPKGNHPHFVYYIIAVIAIVLMIKAVLWKKTEEGEVICQVPEALLVALCCLQILDAGFGFVTSATLKERGMSTSNIETYTTNMMKNIEWGSRYKHGENEFYRTESNAGFTFNPSMFGGHSGIAYYSSTMAGNVFEMFRYLGNKVYADKVSTEYGLLSPIQNSIWGIRYMLDYRHNLETVTPDIVKVEEAEKCNVYENPYALPVAFGSSEKVLNWEITDEIRGIRNQDNLIDLIYGKDAEIFQKMKTTKFHYTNCSLEESSNWNKTYFHQKESGKPVTFHYLYTCQQDGPVYMEHNFRAGKLTVMWEGHKEEITKFGNRCFYLGEFKTGDEITIDFELENVFLGCCGLNLYYLDLDRWHEVSAELSKHGLEVTRFRNTRVEGTINLDENQMIFTSIPQDGGWKALCDGKKVDTCLIGNTLVGLQLPAGEHSVVFVYEVPGFKAGFAVSMIALMLILLWGFQENKERFQKLNYRKKSWKKGKKHAKK